MAIRKSIDESLVLAGARQGWLESARSAMEQQGFRHIVSDETLGQVKGDYKKATIWGTLQLTLLPIGDGQVRMDLKATANVDNVFALAGGSPGQKIIDRFKAGLVNPSPAQAPAAPAPIEPPPEPGSAVVKPPADWYPDPTGQARLRYWDGQSWSGHTAT